jgi:L-arabinonolactonase
MLLPAIFPEHQKHAMTQTVTRVRISETADNLGESPVWDGQTGRVYWVDSVSRLVRYHEPETGAFGQWEAPSMVGSIGLGENNTLIAGLFDGLYSLDLATGAFTPLFLPEPADPLVRFNDGKVDRFGRYLCGTMGVHADPRGTLYRLCANGETDMLANGIRIANTLCFSPDGETMYFADSLDRKIRAYKYGNDREPLTEPRIFADTEIFGSGPDGATVDAEGFVWVALVQVGRVARYAPDGRLDRLIAAPTDMPSCLAFGGPDLSTLYVTSIKNSGSGRAISRHPHAGCLYAIEGLGVKGLHETRFGQPAL